MIRRGVCAFLGLFLLVNLIGGLVAPGFDCTAWLFDLRPLRWAGRPLAMLAGVAMLLQAVHPAQGPTARRLIAAALIAMALISVANAVVYFKLLATGRIQTQFPVPLSILIVLLLADLGASVLRRTSAAASQRRPVFRFSLGFTGCVVLLPLAQMCSFGQTDYRRRAEAAVVFGARAYADGSCSQALADRVRTACDLYQTGQVDRLILSGGPGDGPTDEPHAMRMMAMKLGVPDSAITLDPEGLTTEATVQNTTASVGREHGAVKLLAVSHGYHLPRIKAAYRRSGVEVYTVPARETRTLARKPVLMAREVVATWAYFFRYRG